ncbi:MAG: murein biosynthesis integral membrane protein MurJ [Actinobacteria bacterium]|nr:murein biosynthesis integral membrane protein MurJ [Actinomycetota bacterium]
MFKDTLVVAIGTAISRLTGLLRVVVFGIIIGQTALADAFDGANNSPNSIYELLVGGLLAASLVPLFTRFTEDNDEEATNAVVSVSLIVLGIATAVAIALAPLIFRLFSLHVSPLVDPQQFRHVGTVMTRIFLVQIFFYGLTAIASALLNARRHFFAAAWCPVLSNVITITMLLIIPFTRDGTPGLQDVLTDHTFFWLFTLSATGGVMAMGLVLIPALKTAKISLKFTPNFSHPAVRTMVKLSSWTFGYVVTNQIALVVIKNLAEPGSGNQDAYSKAFTFFMLPHGLLAISIATTFVPELVRRVRAGDKDGFGSWLTAGVRWISILTIPASVAIVILAHPIISAILEHGHFDSLASHNTSRALAGFSIGLAGFSIYIFCLRGFYAHEDTRTPFFINVFENALNIALALVLVNRHGVLGLGMSFGIAYMVSSVLVLWLLHKKYAAVNWLSLLSLLWRAVIGSAVMGVTIWWLAYLLHPRSGMSQLAELFLCIGAGLIVYITALYALQVPEMRNLASVLPTRGTDHDTTL